LVERREKLTPQNVAKICESIFHQPVEKITAPGGKSRESLRVHFATHTIIATQRAYSGRMRLEVEVLRRLSEGGAPVPKFLGGTEQVFFQQDVGARRLSSQLADADARSGQNIAARAFASLIQIHEAGEQAELHQIVPKLGAEKPWVAGFVNSALAASDRYKISAPTIDFGAITERLHVPCARFLKWDARPGNASIGHDGRVYWFDWEHCGARQGMEDFAWLAGDEFFPLGASEVVAILTNLLGPKLTAPELEYLGIFTTFHIVQRLIIIHRRFEKVGWVDVKNAMKLDKIGVDRALAVRLCDHGEEWADLSPQTRSMKRWFKDCAKTLEAMAR